MSDFRLGVTDGFAYSLKGPIVMLRTLTDKQAYRKLIIDRADLSSFSREHYVNPPFRIQNRDRYSAGYQTGAWTGIASSCATLGLVTLVAKIIYRYVDSYASKFRRL